MRKYLVILLITVAISISVSALYIKNLIDINIRGVVDVNKNIFLNIDLDLIINSKSGSKIFDLGFVKIPKNGSIQIKSELLEYSGDLKLVLNGLIEFKSSNRSYRISMPCIASVNQPCYRVLMVIPGYDIPMNIENGVYNVSLTLEWSAEGSGKFYLKIFAIYSDNEIPRVTIKTLGSKPCSCEPLEKWIVVNSYTLLLKTQSPSKVYAYLWIFTLSNESIRSAVFRVFDVETGVLLALKSIDLYRGDLYQEVLVEIDISR
ncbi:MAG: hypothetical protein LM582_06245 [Desulfurococcaceae archaeon]|nr:hypothetical protein [Desulfurococcaceae archaeon]